MNDEELTPEVVEPAPVDAPEPQEAVEGVEGEVEKDPSSDDPSLEDVASGMGWSPKENWRGSPDDWKPAHEFVQHTAEINSKLSTRLKGFETQLSTLVKTNANMTERALVAQREKLQAEWHEAVDAGDHRAAAQAQQKFSEIQAPEQPQGLAPEAQSFVERNTWMNTDKEAAVWAQTRAGQLAEQGLSAAKQLDIVEREARGLFPEHFEKPKAKAAPAPLSQPGNRAGSKPAAKSFASLPKEAQAAAKEYEKKGIPVEEYVANYYEQMEAQR